MAHLISETQFPLLKAGTVCHRIDVNFKGDSVCSAPGTQKMLQTRIESALICIFQASGGLCSR